MNTFVEAPGRGVPIFHDHFTGAPHGGGAVFEVREDEEAQLADAAVLSGWDVAVHALTFSRTGVAFVAQTELTTGEYGGTTIEALREAEPDDRRFWWRRRQTARS